VVIRRTVLIDSWSWIEYWKGGPYAKKYCKLSIVTGQRTTQNANRPMIAGDPSKEWSPNLLN